jgi:hypothetical protein
VITGRFWRTFIIGALAAAVILALLGWGIAQLLAPPPLERFVSSVFEFQLPRGWQCKAEGGETVCNYGEKPPHSAMCVLAMKYRGAQDTFAAYTDYLSKPREFNDAHGVTVRSEVRRVGTREIAGRRWIVALHYQSEVPGFFTEYLATLTSHIAILVTFSASERSMDQHRKEFETMMSSLKVYERE